MIACCCVQLPCVMCLVRSASSEPRISQTVTIALIEWFKAEVSQALLAPSSRTDVVLTLLQPGKEHRHDRNNPRPHTSGTTADSGRTGGPAEVDIEIERPSAAHAV